MNLTDVHDLVIKPALDELGAYSQDAAALLIGTGLAESGFREIRQQGGGPALGPFQCEPETHQDIWTNYLRHRPTRADAVLRAAGLSNGPREGRADWLPWNWRYAAAIARVHYMRVREPIPSDLQPQAEYWLRYYNAGGKGSVEHYLSAWNAAVGG